LNLSVYSGVESTKKRIIVYYYIKILLYMKNMKKKMTFLALALFVWSAISMKAQVQIGGEIAKDPHKGAVLDLSKVNNQNLGLLLPRVSLANVTDWQLEGSSSDGVGMMVYNLNPGTTGGNGKAGVYIWTGADGWEPLKSHLPGVVQVGAFDLTPSSNVDIYAGETVSFTASNFVPINATYQGVTWVISNGTDKASINGTNQTITGCSVTGLSVGTATLTVTSLDGQIHKTVTVNVKACASAPAQPGAITLSSTAVSLNGTFTASVPEVTGPTTPTSYTWTLPGGLNGSSTSRTITITGSTAGTYAVGSIKVSASNACGTSAEQSSATDVVVLAGRCLSVEDVEKNVYTAADFGIAGCWMTQNLRTKTYADGTALAFGSEKIIDLKYYNYPNGKEETFKSHPEYGLLYTWSAASGRTATINNNEANKANQTQYQGICPDGWHLPSDYEWNLLEEVIARSIVNKYSTTGLTPWGTNYQSNNNFRGAHGQKMKSVTAVKGIATNGTSNSHTANGFDALLVGMFDGLNAFNYGKYAYFWSSSNNYDKIDNINFKSIIAWNRSLSNSAPGVGRFGEAGEAEKINKYYYYSVRCKKNDN
jgi:uncharacterized protein (TIGR02145 family)